MIDLSNNGDLGGKTYTDEIISVHGTANNPIVLRNGTLVSCEIKGASHIIVDGVTIKGGSDSIPTSQLSNQNKGLRVEGSDNITIRNCDISHVFVGLDFLNSPDCEADANFIHDIRTDGVHHVGSDRLRVTRNEFTDWFPGAGDHCDVVQGFNPKTDHVVMDVLIADNIAYRGNSKGPNGATAEIMGINARYYATQKGFDRLRILNNLLIGLHFNGMEIHYPALVQGNEIISFSDFPSKLMYSDGIVTLTGNRALRYAPNRRYDPKLPAPSGNFHNEVRQKFEEPILVQQWRDRVFGSGAPTPTPTPPKEDPRPPVDDLPPVVDDDDDAPSDDTPDIRKAIAGIRAILDGLESAL